MIHFLPDNISSKIKNAIWPIEKEEQRLFLPMALMMLCLLFNFGTLRSIKDSLVVPSIGAEVISFLKLWLVLPSSVIFTLFYVKLSNLINFEKVFYVIISIFLVFFFFFAYIIYPNQHLYHPAPELIDSLTLLYPNLQWFIKISGKWSYALMYIFSELWSAAVINLMFWQFANHIFDTQKARRFYPTLGMIGNIGLILAGNILVIFSGSTVDSLNECSQEQVHLKIEQMIKPVMLAVILSGIVAMLLFRIINKYILYDSTYGNISLAAAVKETKTKLSVYESLKMIVQSKYIGHLAVLILCYGLLINILEGPWKAKIRELYPSTLDYIQFMGKFNIWMGISCVLFMIIGSNILRSFSWLVSALLTPIMMLFTGLIFFIFVMFADHLNFMKDYFNPVYCAVLIGALQNILSKATKYSLFDSTKEMAYIPLPLELKTKGKASVEIMGTKLGKSLGALIQSSIFMCMPGATFDSITSQLMIIFIVVVMIWLWNIVKLNKEYLKLL